jgi:hypothetical protein
LYSHGAGWPNSANAVPQARNAVPATAQPSNRRPIWLFDIFMPLALLYKIPPRIPPEGKEWRAIPRSDR